MVARPLSCRVLALTLVLCSTSCSYDSLLRLQNETEGPLVPYPVALDPPPPHREAHPTHTIAAQTTYVLDAKGFNPVFYQPGTHDPALANGVYLGFDLTDAEPLLIQFKVWHYQVPPGQEGTDPAKQPILLYQGIREVEDMDLTIVVSTAPVLGPGGLPPGGWRIEFRRN